MTITKYKLIDLNPEWMADKCGLALDCPCGCEFRMFVNFKGSPGHNWNHDDKDFNSLTITPSIQRTSHCKTHFSIINGNVIP